MGAWRGQPEAGHLPWREWSPIVSHCGMCGQIDEGPGDSFRAWSDGRQRTRHSEQGGKPSPSIPTFTNHMIEQLGTIVWETEI